MNNPIRFIDPDGMLTDYYNLDGNKVKHVEDGSSDKKIVLTSSKNAGKVDKAIANGEVVSTPTNEAISKMDAAYKQTEATGNEYGFAVATDGSTSSLKTSGSDGSVKLSTSYEELSDAGKTSSYDVHTHPNVVSANGEINDVGAPSPSGTKGGTGKTGDTDSYGKDGPNNSPSVVLGYSVEKTTTTSQIGGTSSTSTTVTKQVGFYNGNGQVGKPIDYSQFKKAATKVNNQP